MEMTFTMDLSSEESVEETVSKDFSLTTSSMREKTNEVTTGMEGSIETTLNASSEFSVGSEWGASVDAEVPGFGGVGASAGGNAQVTHSVEVGISRSLAGSFGTANGVTTGTGKEKSDSESKEFSKAKTISIGKQIEMPVGAG
jgi:hypothetical protein